MFESYRYRTTQSSKHAGNMCYSWLAKLRVVVGGLSDGKSGQCEREAIAKCSAEHTKDE
jgi:hypothetical protein